MAGVSPFLGGALHLLFFLRETPASARIMYSIRVGIVNQPMCFSSKDILNTAATSLASRNPKAKPNQMDHRTTDPLTSHACQVLANRLLDEKGAQAFGMQSEIRPCEFSSFRRMDTRSHGWISMGSPAALGDLSKHRKPGLRVAWPGVLPQRRPGKGRE